MSRNDNPRLRVFLCGDVMTGRGIDQALSHPVNPVRYCLSIVMRASIWTLPKECTDPSNNRMGFYRDRTGRNRLVGLPSQNGHTA